MLVRLDRVFLQLVGTCGVGVYMSGFRLWEPLSSDRRSERLDKIIEKNVVAMVRGVLLLYCL